MPDFETIKTTLSRRDTRELLEIWIEHDADQWTPDAFRAISDILVERGVAIPESGGTGADDIRKTRASAAHKRRTERKAKLGRGVCVAVGFVLALPIAGIGAFVLMGITSLLQIPEKWQVELVAYGAISIFITATGVLSGMLIRRFARPEEAETPHSRS